MNFLLEPLRYGFFQHALLAGVLLGITCGALGCFVVLRGMAFIGDALAHAVLPGVAVAYLLGISITLGAFAAGLLTAFLISVISRTGQVKEDTAIGITFTGAFAAGVALMSRGGVGRDLTHFLFGDILGISRGDVIFTFAVAAIVLTTLALFYRPLLIAAFDATHAAAIRINLSRLHFLLMALLALTIVAGIQAVGVVLIASLLVTPAATARLFVTRLPPMMLLSSLLGALAAVVGMYVSYYAAVASGAVIVLASTLGFALALIFAPQTGVLARRFAAT